MPVVVPPRRVAGVILCLLAAGVLFLAGCRKATLPLTPPGPSFYYLPVSGLLPAVVQGVAKPTLMSPIGCSKNPHHLTCPVRASGIVSRIHSSLAQTEK